MSTEERNEGTYRADDRLDENDDWPGQPANFAALRAMWAERDARYATMSRPLTEEQIESIRSARKREAEELPPKDRAIAWGRASAWYPPDHGQGQPGEARAAGLAGWR